MAGHVLQVDHLGDPSSGIISLCLFMLSVGFSRQKYWSALPFSSPVDQVLSELFSPSWVALHGVALSFSESDKPFRHHKV